MADEPSIYERQGLTTTGTRRGRPSVLGGAEGSTPVTVRLPNAAYDRLQREAAEQGVEFADYLRLKLIL
jgi:hypothetical protein